MKPSTSPVSHSTVQTQRPALGSQVIIQTSKEKLLMKFHQKEEKKIARQMKGLVSAGVEDYEDQIRLLGFNPEEMRRER